MRTERFQRWMELLEARLDPGERLLERGRAFEPHDAGVLDLAAVCSGPGAAVVVTNLRVLWTDRADERWVRELPFRLVRSHAEVVQGHRYAVVLGHERVDRLMWRPAHRFLWWTWGNAQAVRSVTTSSLAFSRPDTAVARAIRSRLDSIGVR